jgi:hypothetical protein
VNVRTIGEDQIPYPHWMAEGEAAGADLPITSFLEAASEMF